MNPLTDLRIAEQRRADFERRAAEYRLARSSRRRRTWPALPARGRPTIRRTGTAPVTCCAA